MKEMISNVRQIGGIETSILDNGAGRGSRIAWVNTGSKLRFKLLLDRAMDISDAFYGENCLCWLSGTGQVPPAKCRDFDWLGRFGGGLLVTCGLSHIGPPESDGIKNRCLHGDISSCAAEIESVKQPDPYAGDNKFSITGAMDEVSVFGPRLRLRRTFSCELGKAQIHLRDEVCNLGNESAPHMMLYHCNLGWPLVGEDTLLEWNGPWRPANPDDPFMRGGSDIKMCRPPSDLHSGAKESVAFINPEPDSAGRCSCGAINKKLGLRLKIEFFKNQLPCLVNWQHWGRREYVTGLEPGTNFPIGQAAAERAGELIRLQPMETRVYELKFSIEEI